jgi:hypothetical protein
MNKNMKFWDYAQEVHTMNIVLCGTSSHLEEAALCNQLKASLKTSLQSECAREELHRLATLKEWIKCVWKMTNVWPWKGRGTKRYTGIESPC